MDCDQNSVYDENQQKISNFGNIAPSHQKTTIGHRIPGTTIITETRSQCKTKKKEVTNHMRHEGIGFLQLEYMHSFAPYSSNTNQVLGKKNNNIYMVVGRKKHTKQTRSRIEHIYCACLWRDEFTCPEFANQLSPLNFQVS